MRSSSAIRRIVQIFECTQDSARKPPLSTPLKTHPPPYARWRVLLGSRVHEENVTTKRYSGTKPLCYTTTLRTLRTLPLYYSTHSTAQSTGHSTTLRTLRTLLLDSLYAFGCLGRGAKPAPSPIKPHHRRIDSAGIRGGDISGKRPCLQHRRGGLQADDGQTGVSKSLDEGQGQVEGVRPTEGRGTNRDHALSPISGCVFLFFVLVGVSQPTCQTPGRKVAEHNPLVFLVFDCIP